jgi:hypothetical protein
MGPIDLPGTLATQVDGGVAQHGIPAHKPVRIFLQIISG